MNTIPNDIKQPCDLGREMKLPPAVRFFEAEPVRLLEMVHECRDSSGRLHMDGDIAVGFEDGTVEWWEHGHANSLGDMPAIAMGHSTEHSLLVPSGFKKAPLPDNLVLLPDTRVWCRDGLIHRDDGPAIDRAVWFAPYQEYWLMGRRHRVNGPAVVGKDETWYHHGLIHRSDGAAVVNIDRRNHYGVWVWYGEVFCAPYGLGDDDFPFNEPPPVFYMTALLSMMTTPVLHPKSVDIIVARIAELMLDFPALWFGREGCDWHDIRRALAIFLEERKQSVSTKRRRKRKAKLDIIPLPDLFLAES